MLDYSYAEVAASATKWFTTLSPIIKILCGLFLFFMIGDWLLGLTPSGRASGESIGHGPFKRRMPGKSLGPLPGWRGEDYHTTNSWADLEDHARSVNGWTGEDDA
ncbi:MAG: hypothetical protein U1E26_12820 [Coriobacteriia bacterium]|nr:hypothetical protein [Coriobacteriia bacterium]